MTLYFSNEYDTAATIAVVVLACLSIVLIAAIAHHRQSATIKAHSFAFLALSLIGSMIGLLGLLTWPVNDGGNAVLCGVRPWAFTIPAYLTLTPLLAKHYRIHRIFNTNNLSQTRRFGVNDRDVAVMMVAMVMPQVVIDIVWSTIAPLVHTGADCHLSDTGTIFVRISIAYIGVLLSFAVYLIVRLRHLASEFNQWQDTVATLVMIVADTSTLVALHSDSVRGTIDHDTLYAVRTFLIMGSVLVWQCVLVLPKLRMIAQEDSHTMVHRPSTMTGVKGPAPLPLPPHALKQLHALNNSTGGPSQYTPMLATSQKITAKEKDVNVSTAHLIEMQALAQANKATKTNYPALSTLVTFISPSEEEAQKQTAIDSTCITIDFLSDAAAHAHAISVRPALLEQPQLDINRPASASLSHANSNQSQSPPSPMKPSQTPSSPYQHRRSKSHVPAVSASPSRRGVVSNGATNERLQSIKSLRAVHTQLTGAANSNVRPNGNGMVNVLKQSLGDHISPLYTPAAITVEQVPAFLQE